MLKKSQFYECFSRQAVLDRINSVLSQDQLFATGFVVVLSDSLLRSIRLHLCIIEQYFLTSSTDSFTVYVSL